MFIPPQNFPEEFPAKFLAEKILKLTQARNVL